MKKILLIGLVFLIVLFGCASVKEDFSSNDGLNNLSIGTETISKFEVCKKHVENPLEDYIKYDTECVFNLAKSKEDCQQITKLKRIEGIAGWEGDQVQYFKESDVLNCIEKLALRNNDLDLCDEISKKGSAFVKQCKIQIAVSQESVELCLGIEYSKECIGGIIGQYKYMDYCSNQTNLFFLQACIMKKLNFNSSEEVKEWTEKLGELGESAFGGTNPFANKDEDFATAVHAIMEEDLSLCDQAGSQRQSCYMSMFYSKYEMKKTDCEKLENPSSCLYALYVQNQDIQGCNSLTNEYQKEKCLEEVTK
ncbi:MAG: hypothetical protein COT90_01955 [Candidatus Diapherotrites archaeon CG10_big_fil_rev_8_21_14_0_10_31_34]|nr:MAG: hypothetical protein COT90_01955 [Candidatus Diapherotrites archaeon CG10_big_fil_rev_8_21_14_0_10_31_34]